MNLKMTLSKDPKKAEEWKKGQSERMKGNTYKLGKSLSEETKKKISESHKGMVSIMKGKTFEEIYGFERAKEIKEKLSESHKGEISYNKGKTYEEYFGEEKAEEIKNKMRGREVIKETRKKMSEAKQGYVPWMKGKHHTEEAKKKLSKAHLGKKLSDETKEKISEGHKGVPWDVKYGKEKADEMRENTSRIQKYRVRTEKERENIGKAGKGRIVSEETRKKISEASKGEKHPNWQGGLSFEPYTLDFNEAFKEKIRERDNHCCVICNKPQEESKYKLSVHHIDYNKKNSFPQNCVTLCRNCHIKTNYNREAWTPFFQKLLNEREGYQYTEDQKIILDFTKENLIS